MDISDKATQQEELAREEALRQIRLPEKKGYLKMKPEEAGI